ncbi:II DNA topoisomerase, partial [mine drainage metagenome]
MSGKILNVMNVDIFRVRNNKVLEEVKNMLGLEYGMDYSEESNRAKLRYGGIMIMADADDDGKHIVGLVINYFYCCFPQLIQIGFVMFYRSPIIRAWRIKNGKEVDKQKFFNTGEYEKWEKEQGSLTGWHFMYIKGLGTNDDAGIFEDSKDPRYVQCMYDNQTSQAMTLAFSKDLANMRKEWLVKWKNRPELELPPRQPVTN